MIVKVFLKRVVNKLLECSLNSAFQAQGLSIVEKDDSISKRYQDW